MKILWHQENMPHMNVRKNKGVTYLTWPEFEKIPGFVHGFSTRLGGVSEGIYSSMNLSFTRGDKEEAVRGKTITGFLPPGLFCRGYCNLGS